MRRIVTSIDINAPAEKVWDVLTDLRGHRAWDPFLVSLEGELTPGSTLTNTIRTPDGKTMVFRPRVLTVDPGRELRWAGTLGASFLFRGEHYFFVTDLGDGRARLTQGEEFSGLLLPLFGNLVEQTIGQFHDMNAALKVECEKNRPRSA
jgi:hypothetical protein